MPITGVFWEPTIGARDIHLMPGLSSPRLDQLLYITLDTAPDAASRSDQQAQNEAQWHVSFDAAFIAPSGDPGTNHGALVDDNTGLITIHDPLPAGPRLRSFIVTATVTQGTVQFATRIRIHIHASLAHVWLTPSTLTVRSGAHNMRFSVLARFDDGSIGDISNWSARTAPADGVLTYVHTAGTTGPVNSWSPAGSGAGAAVSVDPNTGEITNNQGIGPATVTLQVGAGGPTATGTVDPAPSWGTPVSLTRIAGPGFTSMGRPDIHNVLFLPDGFVDDALDDDRTSFEFLVRKLVEFFNTHTETTPYNLLKHKFNYFSAWVPSPEAGCSQLPEFFSRALADGNGYLHGEPVEIPTLPTIPPGEFGVADMINSVGPPSPLVDPPTALMTDAADRLSQWQQLYGPLPAGQISSTFPEWLARDTRVLLNERNTAFHIAGDARPHIDNPLAGTNVMKFHPFRTIPADFELFLNALRDRDGNPIVDADGHPIPPVWAANGKDANLVVMVCRSANFGGSNDPRPGGRMLCVSMDDLDGVTYRGGDAGGYDVIPSPVSDLLSPGMVVIVAHELAHSFTLQDEYGVQPAMPATRVTEAQQSANTQEIGSLLTGTDLMGDKIKWNWTRLQQAGVLQAPAGGGAAIGPDPHNANGFVFHLENGHGDPFEINDIIKLRTRTPRDSPTFSTRLIVTGMGSSQITAAPLPGPVPDLTKYGPGDLVVRPVRAPDPPSPDPNADAAHRPYGDDLTIVHPMVIAQISGTHKPLNASAFDDPNRACSSPTGAKRFQPVAADNFLVPPPKPPNSYQLVGIYEGGITYDCGVYHPTGYCIMNSEMRDPASGHLALIPFCTVCRYAMVDLIDPSGHGAIEDAYSKIYPQ